MVDRHKTFTVAPPPDALITFTLADQDFSCRPALPGTTLLEFVKNADSGDGGLAASAMLGFIEIALLPEDLDRFRELADDPEISIPVETIGELCGWLVEEYTRRPTKKRPSSRSGRSPNGAGSTAPPSETE